MVEARADAHGVMPGDRECPPHESAKNPLPDRKRDSVALFCEEPGHERPADSRERYQDGIGPVKQGEKQAGKECGANGIFKGSEEPISYERI